MLAVGAEVISPPLQGNALELVYSVNDLLDYDDFRTAVTDWRVLISSSSAKLKMMMTSKEKTSMADSSSRERNSAARSF